MPPNSIAYLFILVHTVASALHGWSHFHTGVPTSFAQNVFISTVIFAAPPLAATLIASRKFHFGYALLFSSMIASLIFGVAYHFVLDTPDSVVHVCGVGARMFLASAALLALVELVGAVWAVYCWRRLISLRSSRLLSVVAEKASNDSFSQS